MRNRSEAGRFYRVVSDCAVPIVFVVFVLLVKRREGPGGELDGIGRVIRQRLRRRYSATGERQHVETWSRGACRTPLACETSAALLRRRSGTEVCGEWG